jgi:hypothetical protein
MQAPSVVRANADGTFTYTWRFVADEEIIVGGYSYVGVANVNAGVFADCFCDPIYCRMLPGDEIEVYVYGSLINISQEGWVKNHFSDCGYGYNTYTRVVSPTTDVGDGVAAGLNLYAAPNPCRENTWIHYSLPTDGRVRITVHDVSGRRVATLLDATETAGAHSVSWKLQGDAGRLPPAVYFAAMDFGGHSKMQRILVLK